MRKVFKAIFFITLSVIVLFALAVCVAAFFEGDVYSASVGVIGGADGPTAILVTDTFIFGNSLFLIFCFVFVAFVVSAIGLVVTRNK